MTQHGSFPDRPRGRRARHGSDPQWQSPSGEDGTGGPGSAPQGDREFPDLEPIRGPRLGESDNRRLPGRGGGRHGRHGAPDTGGGPGADGGPATGPGPAAWREAGRPSAFEPGPQQYGQYGQPYDQQPGAQQSGAPLGRPQSAQFGGQSYPGQSYPGQSYPGQPETVQPGLDQQGIDQPGLDQRGPVQPGPRRPHRGARAAARVAADARSRSRAQVMEDPDEITDDPMEAFSERWARRGAEEEDGGGGRRRLMWFIGGGGVIVVAVAVAVYFLFGPGGGSSSVGLGSLVTTFLPGEIQSAPDACNVISAATISQYMPGGQPDIAAPPLNGGADSQCTWTLDNPPNYRVIEVDINAFSPSALASGTGSATFAAEDAYAADLQTLKSPSAGSGQPKAVITDLTGLGEAAFSATQVFNVNGATTYKATVVARYHNVIVTAVVNGLDHAVTKKGTYGPVSMSTLSAAASQAATQAVAHLHS